MITPPYYYDAQIKRVLTQFMAIFAGFQVKIGAGGANEQLITVPIVHGNKDRVVGAILSDNTQNKLLRLPTMAAHLRGITPDPTIRKGIGVERTSMYSETGQAFPDNIKAVVQKMPVPYRGTFEVSIYTSNLDQRWQILEQILMIFNPSIQIQTSDGMFDMASLKIVELIDIQYEDNYPINTSRRVLVTTLTFTMPVYISSPTDLRTDIIHRINVRIGMIPTSTPFTDNEAVKAALDAEGIQYETWFDLDKVTLPPE